MTLQEHIDEIMDNFDFEGVHKYMKSVNWEWATAADGVPSIAELRKQARQMIKMTWQSYEEDRDENYHFTTEGDGLLVSISQHADGKGENVRLIFVAFDWDSCAEEKELLPF